LSSAAALREKVASMMRLGSAPARIGAGKDQRRDPVREHRRLPRARAGDDKER
jgi:hypothetical protein